MGSKPVGISASRGAAVLGISDWQTQFEVWQLIMEERQPGFNASRGYVLPEFKESASLRWGNAFEDANIALSESASRDLEIFPFDGKIFDCEGFYFFRDSDPNITHPQGGSFRWAVRAGAESERRERESERARERARERKRKRERASE